MKKSLSTISLKKETIETLDSQEMNQTTGGFTYSLSLGIICKHSKYLGVDSAYECGKLTPQAMEEEQEEG